MGNYIPRALITPSSNTGTYSGYSGSTNLTFNNYPGSSGPGGLWNGYAFRSNLARQNSASRVTMDPLYYNDSSYYNCSYNNGVPGWLQKAYEGTMFFSMLSNFFGGNK